jgi:hypothetical protein
MLSPQIKRHPLPSLAFDLWNRIDGLSSNSTGDRNAPPPAYESVPAHHRNTSSCPLISMKPVPGLIVMFCRSGIRMCEGGFRSGFRGAAYSSVFNQAPSGSA